MKIKNKYFYFGKIPLEFQEDSTQDTLEGWEPGWYFRAVIEEINEEIKIEDSSGRYVPINFEALFQMINTLQKVQNELVTSLVGAPNTNA